MTQTKFIELLNLYLDHEISLEEASQLEAEIQRDPERRKLYDQYCQMQKGCTLLADVFTSQSTEIPAFGAAKSIKRPLVGAWTAGIGAMAAAACVAFVFVNRPGDMLNERMVEAAPVKVAAVSQPAPTPTFSMPTFESSPQELQTVFTPHLIRTKMNRESARAIFANEVNDRFDWMDRVELDPLESEDLIFQVEPAMDHTPRTYRSRRPFEGRVEMTAFQFQR